nr:glycosyltransferase family 1 protein [Paraburkholderia atlantica]
MLPILLDISRLIGRLAENKLPTGVDRVGIEYIRRYGTCDSTRAVLSQAGYSAVLSRAESQRAFELVLEQRVTSPKATHRFFANAVWRFLSGSDANGFLLHTSHSGLERERYLAGMCRQGIRPIVLVHDLIPLTHGEYCRPGIKEIHRRRMRFVLEYASGILANSNDTLESLASEASRLNLIMPARVVARLAPGIIAHSRTTRPCEWPFFVMLGTIEPRKNHWFLLHVWRRLVEQLGTAAPKLVVIGRRGWECENVIDMLERCESLKGVVIEEAHCSDEKLHAYLQHCQALLFPSFVEGYGMPLAEALALKVPVLASDLAVFHEIADDIPDYLDPLDGPGWLARIQAYAQPNSHEREAQLSRIERFREPTWAEHFERVDAFLETLR